MIQNAEDAGAREVDITYSERQFGKKSLLHDSLAEWQGMCVAWRTRHVFEEKDNDSCQERLSASRPPLPRFSTSSSNFLPTFSPDSPHFLPPSPCPSPTLPSTGPALYVYNSAIFREEDFASLSQLAQSNKRDDPAAAGRFGLGFNSAYHFTDLPGIFSGDKLAILDPHRQYLPAEMCEGRPGLKLRRQPIALNFPDQLEPFTSHARAGGAREGMPGTLFRFPLRTAAAAEKSKLKPDQPYTSAQVYALLTEFKCQAQEMLLFLRNVCRVRVLYEDAHGTQHTLYELGTEPVPRSDVEHLPSLARALKPNDVNQYHSLRKEQPAVQLPWSQLVKSVGSHADLLRTLDAGPQIFDITIKRSSFNAANEEELPPSWLALRASYTSKSTPPPTQAAAVWLLVSTTGAGKATAEAAREELRTLHLVPWSGVAVPITQDLRSAVALATHPLLFVNLPLPVHPPLPLHLDGQFEISDNRRDLWSGSDMTGDGRARSRWNESLFSDASACAYIRALQLLGGNLAETTQQQNQAFAEAALVSPSADAGASHEQAEAVPGEGRAMLPAAPPEASSGSNQVRSRRRTLPKVPALKQAEEIAAASPLALLQPAMREALSAWWRLLPGAEAVHQPTWSPLARAVLSGFARSVRVPSVIRSEGPEGPLKAIWLPSRETFFFPASAEQAGPKPALLRSALINAGLPLACCDADTTRVLVDALVDDSAETAALRLATPAAFRALLRSRVSAWTSHSARDVVSVDGLPSSEKAVLLQWAVSDLSATEEDDVRELLGLAIIPLADGSMGRLQMQDECERSYVVSNVEVARLCQESCADSLLDPACLAQDLGQFWRGVAEMQRFNVQAVRPDTLDMLLRPFARALQRSGHEKATYNAKQQRAHQITGMWSALADEAGVKEATADDWKAFLEHSGDLKLLWAENLSFHALNNSASCIITRLGGLALGLRDVIAKLGVHEMPFTLKLPKELQRASPALHDATPLGVAAALVYGLRQRGVSEAAAGATAEERERISAKSIASAFKAKKLSHQDRQHLFTFLASGADSFHTPEGKSLLRQLPIFPIAAATPPICVAPAERSEVLYYAPKEWQSIPGVMTAQCVVPPLSSTPFSSRNRENEQKAGLRLCEVAGVHELAEPMFVKTAVLNSLSKAGARERVRVSAHILERWPQLKQDSFIVHHLENHAWVPSASDNLHQPKCLHHPDVADADTMLARQDAYPSALLRRPAHLKALVELGMHTRWSAASLVMAAEALVTDCEKLKDLAMGDGHGAEAHTGERVVADTVTGAAATATAAAGPSPRAALAAAPHVADTVADTSRAEDGVSAREAAVADAEQGAASENGVRESAAAPAADRFSQEPLASRAREPGNWTNVGARFRAEADARRVAQALDRSLTQRARALMRYLGHNVDAMLSDAQEAGIVDLLQNTLRRAPCVEVLAPTPAAQGLQLPWKISDANAAFARYSFLTSFAAPAQCRRREEALALGSCFRIAKDPVNRDLAAWLGWAEPPPSRKLFHQLRALKSAWQTAGVDVQSQPASAHTMTLACNSVYAALDGLCRQASLADEEREQLGSAEGDGALPRPGALGTWIWADKGFTSPHGLVNARRLELPEYTEAESLIPFLCLTGELDALAAQRAASLPRDSMDHAQEMPRLTDMQALWTFCAVPASIGPAQLSFALAMMMHSAKAIAAKPAATTEDHAPGADAPEEHDTALLFRAADEAHASVATGDGLLEGAAPLPRAPIDMLGKALLATRLLAALSLPAPVLQQYLLLVPTDAGRLTALSQTVLHPEAASAYTAWDAGEASPAGGAAAEEAEEDSGRDKMQFLHPRIVDADAARLGISSLQTFLNANAEHSQPLVCPAAGDVAEIWQLADAVGGIPLPLPGLHGAAARGGPPEAAQESLPDAEPLAHLPVWVVRNVLEVADLLGDCTSVEVGIDFNTYPSRQLLTTELAVVQGPALVIRLKQQVLKAADVAKMLCAREGHTPHVGRQPQGLGLRSVFALSDYPCVLSGAHFCIFDVSGQVFATDDDNDAASAGRAYNFTASPYMFQYSGDQFRPFSEALGAVSPGQPVDSTTIRLPLRRSDGAETVSPMLAARSLSALCSAAGPLLLGHANLTTFAVRHVPDRSSRGAGGPAAQQQLQQQQPPPQQQPQPQQQQQHSPSPREADAMPVSWSCQASPGVLETPAAAAAGQGSDWRSKRRTVLAATSWGGKSSWLGSTEYKSIDATYSARVAVRMAPGPAWSESWIVHQTMARQEARALAMASPFQERGMMPYVGVMMRWPPTAVTDFTAGDAAPPAARSVAETARGAAARDGDAPAAAAAVTDADTEAAAGTAVPATAAAAAAATVAWSKDDILRLLQQTQGLHFSASGIIARLPLPATTQGAFLMPDSGHVPHLTLPVAPAQEEGAAVRVCHSTQAWPLEAASRWDWNLHLRKSLSIAYVHALEAMAGQVTVAQGELPDYFALFPGSGRTEEVDGAPAEASACDALVGEIYGDAQKAKLFFLASGERVKTGDGLILSHAVQPALRRYIAEAFPDCLEMPLRVAEQLMQYSGGRQGRLFWGVGSRRMSRAEGGGRRVVQHSVVRRWL